MKLGIFFIEKGRFKKKEREDDVFSLGPHHCHKYKSEVCNNSSEVMQMLKTKPLMP